MAIIGGAGNPVGGSFTGPAEALEVIGDHAYAMSGSFASAGGGSADTTYLKFTSGNFYLVGSLHIYEKTAGAHERFADVTFNGVNIIEIKGDNNPDWLNIFPIELLIPPYTEVQVDAGSTDAAPFSAVLVGRIYRTRD